MDSDLYKDIEEKGNIQVILTDKHIWKNVCQNSGLTALAPGALTDWNASQSDEQQ